MTELEALRTVIESFEKNDVDYLLVGAVAFNLYGLPRSTKDADFVCRVSAETIGRLFSSLPPGFCGDPQARMELFTGTTRWILQTPASAFQVEVFLLGNDAHHQEEFARRRRTRLLGIHCEAWVATAEDLVIQKLRWSRNKDLDDVRNILSVQRETIDYLYMRRWTDVHGTTERLASIRLSLLPDGD